MYTTRDDVRSVLRGQLGNIPGSAANLSDEQINDEIANAQVQVDLALADRYEVPLMAPVPDSINIITRDIAVYLCDLTYRMSANYAGDSNPIRLRYERALELLRNIATGKAPLIGVDPIDVKENTAVHVFNAYDGYLFTAQDAFGRPEHG